MVGRRVSLNCFKDREVVGIGGEWDAARVRPYADGLLDKTETMVHFERVVGRASRRACRFDPGGDFGDSGVSPLLERRET